MREDTRRLLDIAIEKAKERPASEEPFELKELFGREWNNLSNDLRRDLGREFSSCVRRNMIENVHPCGENQKHHNLYLKRNN